MTKLSMKQISSIQRQVFREKIGKMERILVTGGGLAWLCPLHVCSEGKPLLFLGLPGVISLLVGVLFGVWMLQIYVLERRIVTNIALASVPFVRIGLFVVFTVITYTPYRSR